MSRAYTKYPIWEVGLIDVDGDDKTSNDDDEHGNNNDKRGNGDDDERKGNFDLLSATALDARLLDE